MFDPQALHAALFWYALIGTLGSALLAPFTRRKSDAHIAPLLAVGAAMAAKKLFSGVSNFFKGRSQNAAEKAKLEQANKNAREQEAYVKQFIEDLKTKHGIDIYAPQKTTQEGTSYSNTYSRYKPIIEKEYQALAAKERGALERAFDQGDLYGAKQIADVARNAGLGAAAQMVGVQNQAGGRLSAGQKAALARPALEGANRDVLSFQASLPEKNRTAMLNLDAAAKSAIATLGLGNEQRSSTTGGFSNTQTTPADWLTALNVQRPMGSLSTNTGYSGWGAGFGLAGDAAGAVGDYFGMKAAMGNDNLSPLGNALNGNPAAAQQFLNSFPGYNPGSAQPIFPTPGNPWAPRTTLGK